MADNNLYRIDGPNIEDDSMHIVAPSYALAVAKWREHRAKDQELEPDEVEEPSGVFIVCESGDLIE